MLKSKIAKIFHGNYTTSSRPKVTKKFLSLTLAATLLMTVHAADSQCRNDSKYRWKRDF